MKSHLVVLSLGLLAGGGLVHFVVGDKSRVYVSQLEARLEEKKSQERVRSVLLEKLLEERTQKSFSGSGELVLVNPKSVAERHQCIAMWYGDAHMTITNLSEHTGHDFGPVWNQRSPVEILEEQLAFWRGFMKETARLESE